MTLLDSFNFRNVAITMWKLAVAAVLLFDNKDRVEIVMVALIVDFLVCFAYDITILRNISHQKRELLKTYYSDAHIENLREAQQTRDVEEHINVALDVEDELLIPFEWYHFAWHIVFTVINLALIAFILVIIFTFKGRAKDQKTNHRVERAYAYAKTCLGVAYIIQYVILPFVLPSLNDFNIQINKLQIEKEREQQERLRPLGSESSSDTMFGLN